MIDISFHLKIARSREAHVNESGNIVWTEFVSEGQSVTFFCKSRAQAEAFAAAFMMHEGDDAGEANEPILNQFDEPCEDDKADERRRMARQDMYDDRDAPWTGQAEDIATGALPPEDSMEF